MRLAAELNLPLVTVIDTAGAALSRRGVPEHERSIYQLQHDVVKGFG